MENDALSFLYPLEIWPENQKKIMIIKFYSILFINNTVKKESIPKKHAYKVHFPNKPHDLFTSESNLHIKEVSSIPSNVKNVFKYFFLY